MTLIITGLCVCFRVFKYDGWPNIPTSTCRRPRSMNDSPNDKFLSPHISFASSSFVATRDVVYAIWHFLVTRTISSSSEIKACDCCIRDSWSSCSCPDRMNTTTMAPPRQMEHASRIRSCTCWHNIYTPRR